MKRHHWSGLAASAILCGALLLGAPPSAEARTRQDAPAEGEDTEVKKDSRQAAKEARIAEYLRKREERRIRREQRTLEQEAARQEALAAADRKKQEAALEEDLREGEKSAAAEVAADAHPAGKREKAADRRRGSKLPRGLARAQEAVRTSRLGQDPNMQEYLSLVERQEASPQQLGAIGNFLAQAGMGQEALEYYGVALRLDKKDPILWINAGTLHRQAGRTGPAIGAYQRALALDGNSAVAHYNLGATYDALGKYEDALEEYKIALRLDPELGNPAVNPQAANNDHLTTVKLMLYREQAGSLGIPMINVPGGQLETVDETKN